MSAPAVVVPASMEAPAALALMEERKIRRLPVVEDRRLVGMITDGDLRKALGPQPMMWRRLRLKLSDIMTAHPVAVSPDETLERVARLMLEHKIGGLPVVEGGVPIGIITESDVFRVLCKILVLRGRRHGAREQRVLHSRGRGRILQRRRKRASAPRAPAPVASAGKRKMSR
jgi:CBS-domain-containing membrane protein